ncbi:MAG: beta-galactosidase [Rectinemataceae bacterium]|nr:beta-galactosidase [Rectinemataceae bacterium]
MTETLDLATLKPLSGRIEYAATGLVVHPEEDGVFCLSLDKASSGARWTPERYLTVDMNVDIDRMPVMYIDFVEHSDGAERILSIRYFMIPTRRVKMTVQLSELDSHRFFLPTYPGTLKGHVEGEPTHIDRIDELRIRIRKNDSCRRFELYSLELSDSLPDMRIQGAPMVDEMGQRKGFEWPGKMHSVDEMTAYLRTELEGARAQTGAGTVLAAGTASGAGTGTTVPAAAAAGAESGQGGYPADWSHCGGWKKLRFGATGFFRTHHDGKRWWLVDPEGYAFYSNGVCYGSRMGVHGFVDRMEEMFDWLPAKDDPTWKDCWTEASKIPEFAKRNGAASGVGRLMFNFPRANMIRAFGPDAWWDAWVEINAARMRLWGVNTIGVGVNNYIDERVDDFLAKAGIPFVVTLKNFPLTQPCIYRDFPDVFSPEYSDGSERFAREQLAPFAGNPLMIGYFITNEPEWLFQDSVNPAERILAHEGELHSKTALIEFLRARYVDDIGSLNLAWGLSLSGFFDLEKPLPHADALSGASRLDLEAFRDILIAKYCSVPSDALARVDPDHLNLGMRYSKLTPNEFAGNDAFDICSFNCYKTDPRPKFDIVAEKDRRPGLIGEWHIAGYEMRNLAAGLVFSPNQIERTKACLFYMEQAMAHKTSVGAHYFEWNDQPVLGRFDGECMQHGLISLCNLPYPELTAAMENLAPRMYGIVAGEIPPTTEEGETIGNYS